MGTHTQHKGEEEEEEKTNKQIASVSKSMLKQKKEKRSYIVLKRKDRALFFSFCIIMHIYRAMAGKPRL